jgi:HAD superfamily hydrolase (TIGR01509 family)
LKTLRLVHVSSCRDRSIALFVNDALNFMTPRHPLTSGVIFDCDGVLVNSEEIALEVELALFAEVGLVYDRDEYMARFMGTSEESWWQHLEADAQERLGRSIMNEVRGPLAERMRTQFKARLAEIPGAAAAVSKVRLPRAVASSSGTQSLRIKLKRVGHWDLFAPHVYSADDVVTPKPAPDLFLFAAEKLGVDPTRCVVIEDSVNGIIAGRAAGMRVWGLTAGRHHGDDSDGRLLTAGAERVFSSWAAAAHSLERL